MSDSSGVPNIPASFKAVKAYNNDHGANYRKPKGDDIESVKKFMRTPEGQEDIKTTGVGSLYQNGNGAYAVFSQFPLYEIPDFKDKKFIFLVGPTPEEFGQGSEKFNVFVSDTHRVRFWRRAFLEYLDTRPEIDSSYVIVLPEPCGNHWKVTDYPGVAFPAMMTRQIVWEKTMLDQAKKTGAIVMFCWPRWTLETAKGENVPGNAGPTTRFEVGNYIEDESFKRILWIPTGPLGAQTCEWAVTRAAMTSNIDIFDSDLDESSLGSLDRFFAFIVASI